MNKKTKQILFAILGNLIIGFSIGLLRLSKLGVDPLSFMNSGFSDFLNKDFGTVITVTNFILIVLLILFLNIFMIKIKRIYVMDMFLDKIKEE